MNKQSLRVTCGSYKKKVQNTRRTRVFSSKLGFFARFLNMSVPFFLWVCLALPLTTTAQVVDIPDSNLRAAVEKALGKASGATITTDEMATLIRLDASNTGIHDLNGLEAATNLTRLDLDNNSIADISALGDLTQLQRLELWDNSISDISALAGLINLRTLDLGGNSISDISALGRLTQLTKLDLSGTSISDISALGGLTELTWLELGGNLVSDISALGGLTELTVLNLWLNSVSDISALGSLTELTTLILGGNLVSDISALGGLTKLTRLNLWRNSVSDISALSGLTELRTLTLGFNSVSDISALGGLTELTWLELNSNSISDISALSGLTELTWLNLTDNWVSDVSPLVANTGLGNGDSVNLRGNRLNALSFDTYIPTLRRRGVTVEAPAGVWSLGEPYTVRLIYFLPNDRQSQPDIDTKMDTLIKEVQQLYADQMESHGFGRKTFRFETDATGKAIVHRMNGKFNTAHYQNNFLTVRPEIWEQFDESKTIYLCALDIPGPLDNQVCGFAAGGRRGFSGFAIFSTPDCLSRRVIAHELGHTFGLRHDFRNDAYVMSYGSPNQLSECAAEWLDVHRYFNTKQSGQDARNTTIQMFPPSLASPPNAIRFRFEATDPDGLHQAQLYTQQKGRAPSSSYQLVACKRLTGASNTFELVTTELRPEAEFVALGITDVHGNSELIQRYPIDMISLLPAPEVVSIPDANLAAAVRGSLGLAPGDTLTSHTMLELRALNLSSITDLTGLEYAPNLTKLGLYGGSISDISALEGLTQLQILTLSSSRISDISALGGLTQLTELVLGANSVSDISVLGGLTELTWLNLTDNLVSDLSPLVANTGLGSGDKVDLVGNPLSHTSINTHIPILQSRGITVRFDDEAYPALLKITGDNQTGAADTVLSDPFVVEVQDENGSTLAGVSVTFTVVAGGGMLSVTNTRTDEHGRVQSTLTLGPHLGTNTVAVSASGIESPATFHAISSTESPLVAADVNNDGLVNVLDLILIASNLGQAGQNDADVNGDGVITVLDLVMVAGLFDVAAAAPAAQPQVSEAITAVEVQGWLAGARSLEIRDPIMKRGVLVLEQLLISLTPKETELLANYPNPFNPETWIPYRLAEDAFVALTIYDSKGQVVRTLDVGHRIASAYENRSKAIYWDGRNDLGEGVASGVYFYHLSAGDYSATRKMLILK